MTAAAILSSLFGPQDDIIDDDYDINTNQIDHGIDNYYQLVSIEMK